MAYDNGRTVQYLFQAVDVGAATITEVIPVPKDGVNGAAGTGRAGKVINVHLFNVTEAYDGTDTIPNCQLGVSGTLDKYFESGSVSGGQLEGVPASGGALTLYDNRAAGVKLDIPAGEDTVTMTFVRPTGATQTGISDILVEILWYGSVS